jgi:salicylate hydroxylase
VIELVPESTVEFQKCLHDINQTSNGVHLSFTDGSTACASAVICCDGIKSRGRKILLGENDPRVNAVFADEYAYRTLVPREIAIGILREEAALNGTIYCGNGGYVITYPVDRGKLMNLLALKRVADKTWESDEFVAPGTREQMFSDFEGWGKPIIQLLQEVKDPSLWGVFDSLPLDSFWKGRTCLMGDAAHASTPNQGAGAGMAFEDAYILSGLLGSMQTEDDVQNAFRAFDAVRRPRTQGVVTTSRDSGLCT